jgi:hypothetical protein
MLTKELDFPPIINVGIYRGACQCKCVHCPVGIIDKAIRRKYYGYSEIEPAVLQSFCSEIKDQKTTARLHAVGEPTLHSQFNQLLQIIRNADLQQKFWIFSNGLFKPGLIPELVESLGIIEVSINATNEIDYLQTKGIDSYKSVLKNVDGMRDWITKRGLSTRIVLTRVQSSESGDQEFINFWSKRNFECFVRSFHTYSGILHRARISDQPAAHLPKCLVPWRRLNLDGTILKGQLVAVNCFNILFQHPGKIDTNCVVGRFPDLSLSEIWNGQALQKIRSKLELGLPTFTACDHCTECLTNVGPRAEDLVSQRDK